MKRIARLLFIGPIGLMLIGVVTFYALTHDLPSPDRLLARASSGTTKILDRHGNLLYEILDPRSGTRTRLTLAATPLACRQATIATEDASFYSNAGIDLRGIVRAALQNTQSGEIVSGGSTITQQLARTLLMSTDERSERTLTRKLREIVLALRISERFGKDDILTLYLNEIYYGNLAYGLEAAAQTYFDTSVRNLDLAQCALLAGLPQRPAQYNPLTHPHAARDRQRIVLGLMVEQGYITSAEADEAANEPMKFRSTSSLIAPHFVVYVRQQLEEAMGAEALSSGEWIITTTLDLDLQRAAEEAVKRHIDDLRAHDVGSAAVVVLDPRTGEILTMVGSADYSDDSMDGAVNATLALRQPGSAMKPILYALAFARGRSPGDVVYDVPTAFVDDSGETYIPANYDNQFHGPVSLRQALANSYNLPAVILQKQIGTGDFLALARAMGLTTLTDARRYGLTLTLGGGEVRLLDLTAAYGIFANGGHTLHPCSIKEISSPKLDSSPVTFHREPSRADSSICQLPITNPQSPTLLDPRAIYLLTDVLSDNDARADQFGLFSPLRMPFPVAAKTGTTSNYRDNWTLGYTPQRVVGVWVGNPDGHPMSHISGVDGAGPIWHAVMLAAQQQLPFEPFAEPAGIDRREVCVTNGLTPGPGCPYRRSELYLAESPIRPVEMEYTRVDGKLVWRAPAELKEWAREHDVAYVVMDQGLGIGDQGSGIGDRGSGISKRVVSLVPRITSPAPETHMLIDSHLPLEAQQLEVTALIEDESNLDHVEFVVDGTAFAASTTAPYRVWWTVQPGEHQFAAVAIDRHGQRWRSELVRITIER